MTLTLMLSALIGFLMLTSGIILVFRLAAHRDPFDLACLLLWGLATPVVALLLRFALD